MVLFALLIFVLIGFAGLAIDGGRLYIAKSELQKAVDAGALAGADALVDDYLRTNRNFDSTADGKIKNIARDIANSNYTAKTYDPSADYVSGRKENFYIVEGTKNVNLLLMPVLHIANTTEVKAFAKVKITRPAIKDLIPIGIKFTPDKPGNLYDLTFEPGDGEKGNYGLLNFDKIYPPGSTDVKCNSGGSKTVGEYIRDGFPNDKDLSINMIICTETGDPIDATPIVSELNKRDIVYVPIISGTGTGTSPRIVTGFAAFELQHVDDKAKPKPKTVIGKFIGTVNLDEISTEYSSKIVM